GFDQESITRSKNSKIVHSKLKRESLLMPRLGKRISSHLEKAKLAYLPSDPSVPAWTWAKDYPFKHIQR
ncbi:MAG: hypothetical protein LH702_31680, partial [Phormidesmis sp. CAN_BIN44]|nr:hypothetical protein [Phormidesmis sp. CAN_BIN44]